MARPCCGVPRPAPRQSTEAVDNSVDNMGSRALITDGMGPAVKLVLFSPMKKIHIFH
jgi:hypothetical protein